MLEVRTLFLVWPAMQATAMPNRYRCGSNDANLSGTESAILNRESGGSEWCDSNRAIPRSL